MDQTLLSPAAQPLSPAAQGVWEAFEQAGLAGAFAALADQVVPANGSRKNNEIRAEILAIAAELGGGR
jgi:hypothetical protein